jgi:hypothetical protein
MTKESEFQRGLIKDLKEMFKGCFVFKLDCQRYQGIPDLLILFNDKWASLECKRACKSSKRPKQDYYVELMNKMSFSRFINPENKEEVLHDLQQTFGIKR